MDEKLARVLNGFDELTATQQGQFFDELRKLREAAEPQKKVIREHFEKSAHMKLGPISDDGCPCCGR